MQRRQQQDEQPRDEPVSEYEPPTVEDLDTTSGPVATPPGGTVGGSVPKAAPREI